MGKNQSNPKRTTKNEKLSQQAMLVLKVRTKYEKLTSKATCHRTALKIYSKVQNNNLKARIFQIYNCVVSLKTQLDASNPEKLGIKDKSCNKKYKSLKKELEDLLEEACKIIQMAETQQIIYIDSSSILIFCSSLFGNALHECINFCYLLLLIKLQCFHYDSGFLILNLTKLL
ncbi:unnamed protein product [Moneuplotes crassus]|uniref:Uncharacterized protein n=1 Tax=Euplotes crassus TaxID=5936 RepID=A0AAD1UR70_EUPCR|nr:unnamed protein product [Moneuplotes crassus]